MKIIKGDKVEKILNWNNEEIDIARSKGGKACVCNYEDNLIIPNNCIWPNPDILKKLYANKRPNFNSQEYNALSNKLGFYCDLQSLRSEDAITWSVFGTLTCFPKSDQLHFIDSLLEILNINEKMGDKCEMQLWSRIAHPDTLVSGGPELDFLIIGENHVIFGESKWGSKIAENQGINKDKSQITLRKEYLKIYGGKIFPRVKYRIVLLVNNEPDNVKYDDDKEVIIRSVSWDTICKMNHPMGDKINKYFNWKQKVGK